MRSSRADLAASCLELRVGIFDPVGPRRRALMASTPAMAMSAGPHLRKKVGLL